MRIDGWSSCGRSFSTAKRRRPSCNRRSSRPTAALISVPQDADGDPVLRACGDALARDAICARSSICRRSASTATAAAIGSTSRRRQARDRRAAANGWRPSRLGRILARGTALPSRSCASPAFTDPDATRCCRSRAATRAASSSPGKSSTAFMSAISRRRSMPRLRARRPAFSTSPTTSRRRPAIRSSSRRSC